MRFFKRALSLLTATAVLASMTVFPATTASAEEVERNGDAVTRTLSVRTDMVHDNPGGNPYETQYDDCEFLSARGLSGKVFFLSEAAQLAIDWQDYDTEIFPVGSDSYNWVQNKKAELHTKYGEAKAEGLNVYFMMDFISLPTSMKTLYGDDILTDGKIDINKSKTQEVMKEMMREIFTEFPEVDGFYLRYGESYVGFYSGYHFGNNPIGVSGTKAADHTTLLKFFRDEVCEKYGKDVVYRTWSTETGSDSFTTSKSLYLQITDAVEPHENLYLAIKHTAGDFWRNYTFNETIGVGKHQQIIEVQCSREYEGKGSYPNYVAGSVINGFAEYEWQMDADANKCLRDVVNCENSLVVGIWTWSRGGGWGGPYINGTEVPGGDEMWSDLNAYVLHQWAQDTSVTDTYLVKQYAKDVLGMNDTDAANFVRLAVLSSDAVLNGIGTDSEGSWNPIWTRDASVMKSQFNSNLSSMYSTKNGDEYTKLLERRQAVADYEEMLSIVESFDDSVAMKDYMLVTVNYGYYFFSLCERMWTAGIVSMEAASSGTDRSADLALIRSEYDTLWLKWKQLKLNNACCPTLYTESMFEEIMSQYVTKSTGEEDDLPATIGSYTNLALGRPASSKYVDSNLPANAVDGDSTTKWGTPSDAENRETQWLQIDLGMDTTFNQVSIEWEGDSSCPKEYKLQISDDGVTFSDILYETNCTGGTDVYNFNAITTRYIRMQGISENGKNGYAIKEFGVYNTDCPDMTLVSSENLAEGKTATASYQHNAFAPSYVTDGDNDNSDKDTAKRWNAGNIAGECWITVDLGSSMKFNRALIYWNMKNCPFGYEIQVSDDAET